MSLVTFGRGATMDRGTPSIMRRGRGRAVLAIAGALLTGGLGCTALAAPAVAAPGYEQVTPVDKNGTEPAIRESVRVSADGNVVHFGAAYSMASARPESAPYAPSYVARRGDGGWDNLAIDPPIAPANFGSAVHTLVAGISRDGTRAIVVSQRALAVGAVEGALNVYRRDLRTGAYLWIASDSGSYSFEAATQLPSPLPTAIVGATADFGRVWMRFGMYVKLTPDSGVAGNLYEWSEGQEIKLVSRKPGGAAFLAFVPGPSDNYEAVRNPNLVSADGRQQILVEADADPSTGLPNPEAGLYIRRDGVTKPVSYSRVSGAGSATVPLRTSSSLAASTNGRFIAFVIGTGDELTDDAGGQGLYLYDREQPESQQLTYIGGPGSLPGATYAYPEILQMSDDGQTVYFAFDGTLFVWRDGAVREIAASSGWGPNGNPMLALQQTVNLSDSAYQASPNGRYFAFPSTASLTGADMRNSNCVYQGFDPSLDGLCAEQFVYDAQEDSIECASCTIDGSGSRGIVGATSINRAHWGNEMRARPIVFDSGKVLFDTPNALVAGDTNAERDVYSYEAGVHELISRGTPETSAGLMTATADGSAVYFVTDDPIVAQDTDRLRDIYLAREGAGLPSQQQRVAEHPCAGSDCRMAAEPQQRPGEGAPASQHDQGSRQATLPKRKLTLRASVDATAARRARVVVSIGHVDAHVTLRVSGKGVLTTTRQVRGDGRIVVSVPLTKHTQRLLRQRGRVSLSLRVSGTPSFGASKTIRVKKSVRSGR